jgi:transglutaminase-like putative cysteine protease
MARTQGTSARTQRLIAGVATVLVAAAAAIALGRVFEGNGPTLRLLAAGVASAVIATLLQRRNLVLATLASVVGLAIAIGWLVFPETTWFGLPTPETARAAFRAAGLVGEQARVQVAPSPPLAPLMLAGLAGVWAAVFAAHSLAFRAGSPLLGLLPPIALVGFADSVLEDVIRPVFGVLFLIAATALLFADGLRRVQGWGPVWTGPGRAARIDIAAGRGARRVAAAAVMVAAIAPIVLPGFGSRGVIDFSTSDDDRVRIDPLVSVQESLQRDEEIPVFDVQADVGRYWRMVALPNFDGRVWSPDPEPATLPIDPGATLASYPVLPSGETTKVTFTTTSELALPWLPLPYPPRETDAQLDDMRWDPASGSVVLANGVEPGLIYTAVADVVQPTPEELRNEPSTAASPEAVRNTATPDVPEVQALAEKWTLGQQTDYDKIIAIQDRFTDPRWGFTYDDTVPGSTSDDAMLEFLTDTRTGFCQQFASAMAVMLRTLGIPARLAVGFTPGEPAGSSDRLTVTTKNAHAWVEVLFPSFGWVPFEPTPNRQNVVAYPYLDPDAAERCDGPQCEPVGRPDAASAGGNDLENPALVTAAEREAVRPGGLGGAEIGRAETVGGIADASQEPGPLTARNVLVAGAIVAVAGLLLVPPLHGWRRRRRLRRAASSPRSLILATYDVFTDRAAELGHPRAPGQTLEEYRRAVGSGSGGSHLDDLDALTRLATGAAYAGREPDPADAEAAGQASEAVVRAMRRRASLAQRLTGPYRRR